MTTKSTSRIKIVVGGEETLLTNVVMMDELIRVYEAYALTDGVKHYEEFLNKAKQHRDALNKTNTEMKIESPAARENKKLSTQVLSIMPSGEVVSGSWIMERVRFIGTSQKLTKVMNLLVDDGKVEKVKIKSRYIGYKKV